MLNSHQSQFKAQLQRQLQIQLQNSTVSNDRESYADIIRQKYLNQANETSSDYMKNMMKMLQQVMQQLMTVTNLLIDILPNPNQSSLKPYISPFGM